MRLTIEKTQPHNYKQYEKEAKEKFEKLKSEKGQDPLLKALFDHPLFERLFISEYDFRGGRFTVETDGSKVVLWREIDLPNDTNGYYHGKFNRSYYTFSIEKINDLEYLCFNERTSDRLRVVQKDESGNEQVFYTIYGTEQIDAYDSRRQVGYVSRRLFDNQKYYFVVDPVFVFDKAYHNRMVRLDPKFALRSDSASYLCPTVADFNVNTSAGVRLPQYSKAIMYEYCNSKYSSDSRDVEEKQTDEFRFVREYEDFGLKFPQTDDFVSKTKYRKVKNGIEVEKRSDSNYQTRSGEIMTDEEVYYYLNHKDELIAKSI